MRINFYDLRLTETGSVALVKEKGVNYGIEELGCPESVALLAYGPLGLGSKTEEHIYMLAINSAGKVIGVFLLSKGIVDVAIVSPREIFIRALLVGATQIILVHNHPSGRVIPSKQDRTMTRRIKRAGELLNVALTDHVIVGGGNGAYLSFREAKLL